MSTESESDRQAALRGAGEQPEALEPTPAGEAILRADHVAMIQGMADYWSGQPLPPQMQAFLADDVPALVASHAALTARLAAVEMERDAAVAALTALEQVICSSVVLPYAPEGPPDGR